MPYGNPSYAYTNSVPDQQSLYPDVQHPLTFYIKCVPPVGYRCRRDDKPPLGYHELCIEYKAGLSAGEYKILALFGVP